MINRRVIRTVLNSTEITASLATANGTNYVLPLQTTDALYIGYHGKFAARFFQVGVVNTTAAVLSVDYWNGSAWTAVDDLVDQTSVAGVPFAASGQISWVNKTDWAARSITGIDSDIELYWVRITTSANLLAGTALKSILNLYCDDNLLRAYFPEIISDANYLPDGKVNFCLLYTSPSPRDRG